MVEKKGDGDINKIITIDDLLNDEKNEVPD